MPTIRELITKFSFQVDHSPLSAMRRGLASVGQDMKASFDTSPMANSELALGRVADSVLGVRESFSGLAVAGAAIGVALAGVGTAFGFAMAGVKQTADYSDRVTDTAAQLGLARSELQAMGYVAQLSGSNVDELSTSLRFLNRNAVEAAENGTGPAAEGFKKLGISVKDSSGNFKSSTALLEEMADGFARLPEGPQRSALAMDLLGKSGAAMVPLLSQGSAAVAALKKEAQDFGFVMSDKALDAGAKFNDEMDRLTAVTTGLKNSVGGALLPLFTGWVTRIREIVIANREIISQRLEAIVAGISHAFDVAWRVLSNGYDIIKRIADALGGMEKILTVVALALGALGGLAILSSIGSAAMAIGGMIAALIALDAAAIATAISMAAAWIAAAAVPILIGAALVAVALLFEDIWTYLQGGESAFGKWVKVVDEFVESVKNMARAIGSMLYDNLVQPIIDAYEKVRGLVKNFSGIDLSMSITDLVFPKITSQAEKNNDPTFGVRPIDSRLAGSFMTPAIAPSQSVLSSSMQSNSNTVQNSFVINANGLNEDQARRVVSEEVSKSQKDMFKRAGQNSIRKNRE